MGIGNVVICRPAGGLKINCNYRFSSAQAVSNAATTIIIAPVITGKICITKLIYLCFLNVVQCIIKMFC